VDQCRYKGIVIELEDVVIGAELLLLPNIPDGIKAVGNPGESYKYE
jgi:hypothetical protein